jgi:hypothetical protein
MGDDSTHAAPSTRARGKVRIASARFLAFLTAQALGAANDNALKITLVLFLISVVSGEPRQVRYSDRSTSTVWALARWIPSSSNSRAVSIAATTTNRNVCCERPATSDEPFFN